jgi:tyrosyl-tRNA synthetase
MGRKLQQDYGQPPQIVLTMPLLEGLDGERKMSKSYGNYVGITETAQEMFGKLMSISDLLMWRYYELLTDLTIPEIEKLQADVKTGTLHPMRAKKDIAKRIIADFHSAAEAEAAEENWARQFQKDEVPENLEEVTINAADVRAQTKDLEGSIAEQNGAISSLEFRLDKILVKTGLADSNADAQRKIKAGSLKIDGETCKELYLQTPLPAERIFRVGRKMKKIVLS